MYPNKIPSVYKLLTEQIAIYYYISRKSKYKNVVSFLVFNNFIFQEVRSKQIISYPEHFKTLSQITKYSQYTYGVMII